MRRIMDFFCQLIEFVAEFDPIMQEHLRRVVDKEIQNHYLSHRIQNELISLLAKEIKDKMLKKILKDARRSCFL